MDISAISLAAPPTTSTSATPAVSPTAAIKKWASNYQADHRAMQNHLEQIETLPKMDNVELLRLQALTQRFSLQTELSARVADRLQNAARQLLQQGG